MNGTPTNCTLDLAAGLTQVLADGRSMYLYGAGRIGEQQAGGWMYHLGDALGSVRQLVDTSVNVTLARSYEPFGDPLMTTGAGSSIYGFTGEQRDGTGLVYLRARYYGSAFGRFLSRDPWEGDPNQPMSYNAWLYVHANPVNFIDPLGLWYCTGHKDCQEWVDRALRTLSEGSPTGRRLVEFLNQYDGRLRPVSIGDLLPANLRPIGDSCASAIRPKTGLHIAFVPRPWPGGGGNALFPTILQLQLAATFIVGPDPTPEGVLLLGHELSHYTQGIHRITIQGEVLAQFAEKQLRGDLVFHHVGWGQRENNALISFNPFYLTELFAAKSWMVREVGPEYVVFPLRLGGGLDPGWLMRLAIRVPLPRLDQPSPPPRIPHPATPRPTRTPVPPSTPVPPGG